MQAAAPAATTMADSTSTAVTRQQLPLYKAGITGLCVLSEMASGGLFMENVKMEKQRTSLPYPKLIRGILKQGIRGYEAGLWPWGTILGLTKGVVLGGSKVELLYWAKRAGLDNKNAETASGFGAGAVQGVFMSPILLARTRINQMVTERAANGVKSGSIMEEIRFSTQVLTNAVRVEGLSVLTTGMGVCVVKRSLDWGSRFVFIAEIRRRVKERKNITKLSNIDNLWTAFVGGAMSVAVTIPIDRLMPILQESGKDAKTSLVQSIRTKLAQDGISTMFSGLVMRTVHCGYHTVWALVISDKVYEYFSSE